MEEIWKTIKGYEDYQVSNLGNVKSFKNNKEKVLKKPMDGVGYLNVGLFNNGKRKTFKVHQLVAITFLNHAPNGYKMVVDHINNIRTDNRLENIQVITHRENGSKDRKNGYSKYTGVTRYIDNKKWIAQIGINGINKYLGIFKTELEASNAYQLALKGL
tara:strand:+ start:276 stop:752 length:477 start_codon:yes stop_codon:yes gene_type:complete